MALVEDQVGGLVVATQRALLKVEGEGWTVREGSFRGLPGLPPSQAWQTDGSSVALLLQLGRGWVRQETSAPLLSDHRS